MLTARSDRINREPTTGGSHVLRLPPRHRPWLAAVPGAVLDDTQAVLLNVKLPNRLDDIRRLLKTYEGRVQAVVESTYNWYWLVDGLQAAAIPVTLAHTAGLAAISSAKVKTDRRDAVTLARLLRAGMIPPAYIYPPEHRPIRDLLRHRWDLVVVPFVIIQHHSTAL